MDKTKLTKLATAATITTGMAIALPVVAPFVAPFILPLMSGVLSETIAKEFGKSSIGAITGILGNLAASAIWESPNPLGKNPENQDLLRLLANAYLEAIKELDIEDDADLKEQAKAILPFVEARIQKAVGTKKEADLLELFPLNKDSKPGDLKYSFANRISSGDVILQMADESFSEDEILADEIEISMRRWFNEGKTAQNQTETGLTMISLSTEPIAEPLRSLLRERLAKSIPQKIGELLKQPEFERSWIAFQRSHLQAVLKEIKNNRNGLSEANIELFKSLAEKLDKLANSDFPKQLADSTSQILLRLDESEENIKQLIAEESANLATNFADLLRGTETRLSDKIDETYQQSQDAGEKRKQEILQKIDEIKLANSARQSQADDFNPIPNPIPNAHDVFDRRDECAKLTQLLVAEDTRLIRVVAPSGYGKTKLVAKFLQSVAAQIGERNGESAADGVLFVDCKRLQAETNRGTADIWNEILDRAGWMLGKRREFNDEIRRIQSPQGQAAHLLDALEAAGGFWLVLDNFEDLLDKESGTIGKDADDPLRYLFHQLCTDATKQRLIITTQRIPVFIGKNAPRLSDKHLLEVSGTPETDAVNYLKAEGEPYLLKQINEAVLLDFARRVDCLPLAVVSLLRDLEKHFADKPHGKVTVAEVEAIVQSATHYVETDKESGLRLWLTEQIAKLHADEQIVLSVLSVFGKSCPQTALEFILPNVTADKIERLLALLERNKLLYQEGAGFQLSAIIRDAAYSLIPDGSDNEQQSTNGQSDFNKKALHAQAADFYATQRKPQAEWKTIADVQAQLDEIQHWIYAEEFETAAIALYKIDKDYLFLWGNYRLLIELREQLQDKLPENIFQASFQANSLGLAYLHTGRVRQSIRQFEKVLQIAQSTDNKQNEGAYLNNLGIAYYRLGECQKAIEYHEQSLAIKREIGDQLGEGISLGNLGIAYDDLGEYQKAIEYHKQSLEIAREIGYQLGEGTSLGNLGNTYGGLGEYQKATEYHEQSLEISREISDRLGEGTSLGNLGTAYFGLGEYRKANEHYKQHLEISREIGDRLGEGNSLGNLGSTYDCLGEYRKAIEYHEQSLAIKREIGDRLGEGRSLNNLGGAYFNLGEKEKACGLWKEALTILEAIESPSANVVRKSLEENCN